MDVTELAFPQTNRFASGYTGGLRQVLSFFDYDYHQQTAFEKRLAELKERTFPREKLADVLLAYNRKFSPGDAVLANIGKIKQPGTAVVIGGQQAGVLTGPLYTIHKCLSIIRLAEEQQRLLGVPVVPVFWIAGEDHDFDEINHTYILQNNRPHKVAVPQSGPHKKSVSKITLDKAEMRAWVANIVKSYGETEHTRALFRLLEGAVEQSETFVDFFAYLVTALFKEDGLVLIDSNDPGLRRLETPFFKDMIGRNRELNGAVSGRLQQLKAEGFEPPVDFEPASAHLFYHVDDERVLLQRDESGTFYGKNNECKLTERELIKEAEDHPERMSNNVVTRPLMQELLFPTLAFIGGPGEIAYWGTLKEAFHIFGCGVPPVVPRLNITLVDRQTEKWLAGHDISAKKVIAEGVALEKERWLSRQKQWDVEGTARRTKQEIDRAHEQMRKLALQIDPHLEPLGRKNLEHLFLQIDYFSGKIEQSYREPYERELKKFDRIEACLRPRHAPQERTWNVFPFVNRFGFDLISRLLATPFSLNGKHKMIVL
ncbi:MAG TPA: bacillithiol biosynthesis cysteine-adding enzyme BshC [Bacillales bacterium]|nr:bacillithiol biosynthesis cysteine-adding enzyme BshC [Bacillales bacterium]